MLGSTLKCKDGESHAQIHDNVVIYSISSNVEVVISTITKIILVITRQRQTQQDVLAGQAAIKQNPFVTPN